MIEQLSKNNKSRLKDSLKISFFLTLIINAAITIFTGIILLVVFLIKDDFSGDETDRFVNILIPLLVIMMFIPSGKLIDLASNKKRVLNSDEFQLKI